MPAFKVIHFLAQGERQTWADEPLLAEDGEDLLVISFV